MRAGYATAARTGRAEFAGEFRSIVPPALVTLQRGTEWAATGRVTQKVPATFPTADTVSYRADIAAMDPSYRNGLDSLTAPRR